MLKGRVLWRGATTDVTVARGGEIVGPEGGVIPPGEARILNPVAPSKIVCVGRNYREHAAELGNVMPEEPLIFLKPPSAILTPGGAIHLPPESQRVEYEGEIAVVMGKPCGRLRDGDDPMEYVAGFTPLNDVTARDLRIKDVQFTRAKSFDTFCPFGPWIEDAVGWRGLTVTTRLNGQVVQEGRAADMAFPIPLLIQFISRVMTLFPGDIIATGTPAGVGRLAPGDSVSVTVAGVTLENTVSEHGGSAP